MASGSKCAMSATKLLMHTAQHDGSTTTTTAKRQGGVPAAPPPKLTQLGYAVRLCASS